MRRLRKYRWFGLVCLFLAPVADAQRPMRFSLQTDILDLTSCIALPGNIPLSLGLTSANIEILDWATKAVSSNQPGEFVLKFKQPIPVGSLIQYEGGQVSVQTTNGWRAVPALPEPARKLQVIPLPPGEMFSALKITVPAQKTNDLYQARLSFATLIPVRAINLAVNAEASASSTAPGKKPNMLVDGIVDPKENFSTVPRKENVTAGKPEWVTLTWPAAQSFRGVGLFHGSLDEGFGEASIETFVGTGDPTQSTNGWMPVLTRSTPPGLFRSNQLYVAREFPLTRGLRITATGGVSRAALGEIVVLQDLGVAPAPTNIISQAPKSYTIARVMPGKLKIDGKDEEWPAQRIQGFALQYDDENLYVLFRGQDTEAAFENKGTNFTQLFHTGDALEVMLQTRSGLPAGRLEPASGDIRLLFAMFEGKPVCVLYNFRATDFLGQAVTFTSPTKTVWCDRVELIKDAQIEVKRGEAEYTLEASVSLKAINVLPAALSETRGDVGRVFSDATGTKAAQRVYWSNKSAPPLGDLADEASVQPAYWGTFKFAE